MSYTQLLGRFKTINDVPVRSRFPSKMGSTYWAKGHPIGILIHYTAGCTDDLASTWNALGYGAQFSVGQAGDIYQYKSANTATYHAYTASHYWWGIEHTALPGRCDFTEPQLQSSAKLAAGLVEYAKRKWGVDIPLVHHPRPDYEPGFKDHKDGTRSTWNADVHVDGLRVWTWDEYLKAVQDTLTPQAPPKLNHLLVDVEGYPPTRAYSRSDLHAYVDKFWEHARDEVPGAPQKFCVTWSPEGQEA